VKTLNKGQEKPAYECNDFDKLTDNVFPLLPNITTDERIFSWVNDFNGLKECYAFAARQAMPQVPAAGTKEKFMADSPLSMEIADVDSWNLCTWWLMELLLIRIIVKNTIIISRIF